DLISGSGFDNQPLAVRLTSAIGPPFEAPIITAAPDSLDFQIPWDAPAPSSQEAALVAIGSGLEYALQRLDIQPVKLAFHTWSDPGIPAGESPISVKAAHEDYHGLVSQRDPARPGEVINVYMSGLGPTSADPPTGAPSPSSPPSIVLTSFTCTLGLG